jgi:hypothetical protein
LGIPHDGKAWKIYYYQITNFEKELGAFGNFLEEMEQNGETPTAIIPNVGRPVLSYAGIVGLAVVVRKSG